MSALPTRYAIPLADQPTQTLSREQLQVAQAGATASSQSSQRPTFYDLIEPRQLAAVSGDRWQAAAWAGAEYHHWTYRVAWLTPHDIAEPLGAHGPELFTVPSESGRHPHTVSYLADEDRVLCPCDAGLYQKPCKHAGAVVHWLVQFRQMHKQAHSGATASADLAYMATCEDVERMQGMKAVFALATGERSGYRYDDFEE